MVAKFKALGPDIVARPKVFGSGVVPRPKQTTNKQMTIVHFSCQKRKERKNTNNQSLVSIQS
jgi:hypothetical protein